jgi:hypothetical protein
VLECHSWRGALYTTRDKICVRHAACQLFLSGTLVSSINKTDSHDISETLLKMALSTITPFFNIYMGHNIDEKLNKRYACE